MFTRGSTRITMWENGPVQYNGPWEKLYSFCSERTAASFPIGKENPEALPEGFRYADAPGVRLVPLHYFAKSVDPGLYYDRNNEFDHGVGIYRDGYIWCGTSYKKLPECEIELFPEGAHWGSRKHAIGIPHYLETICLKYANFVYVVDDAAYKKVADEWVAGGCNGEGIADAFLARAKTIVPIDQYDGSYAEPFVVISRDLMFDEVVSIQRIEAVL